MCGDRVADGRANVHIRRSIPRVFCLAGSNLRNELFLETTPARAAPWGARLRRHRETAMPIANFDLTGRVANRHRRQPRHRRSHFPRLG